MRQLLKAPSRSARAEVVPAELLDELLVAVDDPEAAPNLRLGRVSLSSATREDMDALAPTSEAFEGVVPLARRLLRDSRASLAIVLSVVAGSGAAEPFPGHRATDLAMACLVIAMGLYALAAHPASRTGPDPAVEPTSGVGSGWRWASSTFRMPWAEAATRGCHSGASCVPGAARVVLHSASRSPGGVALQVAPAQAADRTWAALTDSGSRRGADGRTR